MLLRVVFVALIFAMSSHVISSCDADEGATPTAPRIELRSAEDGGREFAAEGLNQRLLTMITEDTQLADYFSVYAGGDSAPAMLGETRLENKALKFQPRYPLEPGVTYRAVLRLPDGRGGFVEHSQVFKLDKPQEEPAVVTHVFPSRGVLPENQLKFYIHFSRPMSRGEAYERVTLLDAERRPVEHPFLELGEELWDPSGTRFTLFFDPGRIKRGLKPREEVGPSLEEGKSYTLVVSGQWRDAHGAPLASDHRKAFRVVSPDDEQPNPENWRLAAPRAGTRQPLKVQFPEPLDHAMLHRVLHVIDSSGNSVSGEITIAENETHWRFTPAANWKPGDYRLSIDSALEDLAGNSIRRPFEVDVLRPVETEAVIETVSLAFTIASAASAR
jgi:hypothetical protein